MISLELDLSLSTLSELKREARRLAPAAGSGHLTEAIAHGLGAGSNAGLREVLKQRGRQRRAVSGASFVSSLRKHDVAVPESALFRAAAAVALRTVMRAEPLLAVNGLGAGRPQRTQSGEFETMAERRSRFDQDRTRLEHGVDGFLHALSLLNRFRPLRTVRPRAGSYRLKHVAENLPSLFPDGEELGPIYVSNGQLIAAAIHLGFRYQHCVDDLGWGTLNALFNISAREIEQWDRIARPTMYGLASTSSRPLFLPRTGPGFRSSANSL